MFKNIVLKHDIQNLNCPYQRLLMKPGIFFTNKVTKKALRKYWILSVDDGDLLLAERVILLLVLVCLATMKSHAVLHKLLWRIANLI